MDLGLLLLLLIVGPVCEGAFERRRKEKEKTI